MEERQRSHCIHVLAVWSIVMAARLSAHGDRLWVWGSRVRPLAHAIEYDTAIRGTQNSQLAPTVSLNFRHRLLWELYLFVEQSFAHGTCGSGDGRGGLGGVFGHGCGVCECN